MENACYQGFLILLPGDIVLRIYKSQEYFKPPFSR